MKIGIIGTGKMGGSLGTLWATRRKHRVFFGSRKRIKSESLAQVAGPDSLSGIYEEAAEFGDVVVLGIPWRTVEATVPRLAPYMAGKTVIDIINPITVDSDGLATDGSTSAAEIIQSLAPDAHVVKAFNGIPADMLYKPHINGHRVEVYYCGDDETAMSHTHELINDLGFAPANIGGLAYARYLEAMVFIWIRRLQDGQAPPLSVINVVRHR